MAVTRSPISFVATSKPEDTKAFYQQVLGLTLIEQSPYALAFNDGNHMLRVQIVTRFSPAAHTAHGWRVLDIEREIADLTSKGVTFLKFDQLAQDASGVWKTSDGHKIAWFKDPSGNTLSLTEYVDP